MKPGRNDTCPCGSGKKYKKCCKNISSVSSQATGHLQAAPLHKADAFHNNITKDIELNFLGRAELDCRSLLDGGQEDAQALNALGLIAWKVQKRSLAADYFRRAVASAPEWPIPQNNLVAVETELAGKTPVNTAALPGKQQRFIVIKAWGHGFWSDVDHVAGGLLLAEITGRIPVIHWGSNSLFSDNPACSAFNTYFEPVSDMSVDGLVKMEHDYFPSKWSALNLRDKNFEAWESRYSRMSTLYFMDRTETVVVSDFHLGVVNLVPWIERGHPLHGLPIDDLYRYIFAKYLKPVKAVRDRVDDFYNKHLAGGPFVAVHVRGSDKHGEFPDLDEVNLQYFSHIDKFVPDSKWHIFLLTDSQPVADTFTKKYGNRLVLTDSLRSADNIGIHYNSAHSNKSQLGYEVMIDTYLAAKADRFIGNGASNVSCVVGYLKNWNSGEYTLLVPNMHHHMNYFIYR